jgi:DNA-binding response OmpR family regulator
MTDIDTKIPLLLVEDEPHIAQGLIFNLEAEGYLVEHFVSGEDALVALANKSYALLVLDLMLPGIDGVAVCQSLRNQGNMIPILMLTARAADEDRISGLSSGADDYLVKPFNLKEFLLRIAALLRRSNWPPAPSDVIHLGNNSVNLDTRQVETAHGSFELTEQEIKVLRMFVEREGSILSRGELLKQAWGMAPDTETRTLDNFIVRLRKYFEKNPSKPKLFRTVRGRGYRFINEK